MDEGSATEAAAFQSPQGFASIALSHKKGGENPCLHFLSPSTLIELKYI
jgi:hypothetical protein